MTETTATPESQTMSFQAEVRQVLDLMVHSLYSNKEIFLRELISNSADACDKLRFEALANNALLTDDPDLRIRVEIDREARTVIIDDNGIGMSRDEIVANLGTIARSGTREFLSTLSGDEAKDAKLIGQFGVGFYSSFVVADRVTVESLRAGGEDAVRWESDGKGEFQLGSGERKTRGTTVTLHLREDEDEFLESFRLRTIIRKYSDHIGVPVQMAPEADGNQAEGDDKDEVSPAFENVNHAAALWTRPRQEISDEEYSEFYKHVAHDFEDPLAWSHSRVEGRQEYT